MGINWNCVLSRLTIPLSAANAEAAALENNVEVHPINARVGVVFQPKIDVLADAKTKIAHSAEVGFNQLKLFHLIVFTHRETMERKHD